MRKFAFCRKATLVVAVSFVLLAMTVPTYAAKKNKWVEKKGAWTYYNSKGKLAKGMTNIGGKTYFFDEKGRQCFGWRKVGSDYRFFSRGVKTGAAMVSNTTVDGIKINSSGKAAVNDSNKKKIKILTAYAGIVDSVVFSNGGYSKLGTTKARTYACIRYLENTNYYYRQMNLGLVLNENEALTWANAGTGMLSNGSLVSDCRGFSAAFAYMEHALGEKNVTICYKKHVHAWVKIGNSYYDPMFAAYPQGTSKKHRYDMYFPVPSNMSKYKYNQYGPKSYSKYDTSWKIC